MEGNIFENVHRHAIRYFSSIDVAEAFTSQRFKQSSMSDEVVSKLNPSHCIALLNTIVELEIMVQSVLIVKCKKIQLEIRIMYL